MDTSRHDHLEVHLRLNPDAADITITAVVPAYNSNRIEACLKSILNQSEERLTEIIVVDDGSTDDTPERVQRVALTNPRRIVRLLRLERNLGASAARNAGINSARGTCIATIDSDMILGTDCLRRLTDDLLESGASAAMAYFAVPREVGVLTRVIGYDLEYRLSRLLDDRRWVVLGKVGTGATLFKRSSLLEAGLFDEDRRVGEDTALSYRLQKLGKTFVVSSRARCMHYWQSRGLKGYVGQQIGYGEGILMAYLDSQHIPKDPVSGPLMRLNALMAAFSIVFLLLSFAVSWILLLGALGLLFQVAVDLPAALWILSKKGDTRAGLVAPLLFLVRNYSWVASFGSVALGLLSGRLKRSRTAGRAPLARDSSHGEK